MDLAQFLIDNNMTQESLARYLNVNRSTVSRFISGQIHMSDAFLEKLIYNGRGWNTSSLIKQDVPPEAELPSWKELMYEDMIRERDEKIRDLQERLYALMYKKDEQD